MVPSTRKVFAALAIALGIAACATTTPISSGSDGVSDGGSSGAKGPTGSGDGGSGACGDEVCEMFEDCSTCPIDCGDCGPVCGDGTCDDGEDCSGCPEDCGACSVCGDDTCSPDETCKSCYLDCGICACMPDGFEPNDASPTATPLANATDYCDLSICSSDVDWLEFDVTSSFTAKVTFARGQGDLDMEIYSAQTFAFVNGSYSSDDDEMVTLSGLAPGSYWARVYGKGGATNPDYCFRVDAN